MCPEIRREQCLGRIFDQMVDLTEFGICLLFYFYFLISEKKNNCGIIQMQFVFLSTHGCVQITSCSLYCAS